jgi:pyruvate,orthophosphate dikinase
MDNFTNGGKGMSKKYLYYFSEGSQAFGGDKTAMRNTLGGKGSGLAEMTAAGMPVPQGFTITTEACTQYYTDGRQINAEIQADIFAHVKGLEEITGKKLGDVENPLLVSVRSGARQSMPGMMDTILNLGLNDASVEGLAKKTGALPTTATAALCRCLQTSSWACPRACSRKRSTR